MSSLPSSRYRSRLPAVLLAAAMCACLGLPGALISPAAAAPVADSCPHRHHTPPAVDTSEVPAPGTPSPAALPVRTPTAGGDRLSGCEVIAPVPDRGLAMMAPAGWLIADLDSGDVLAARDAHGRYRPASTIKVLLALVAIRDLDLDTTVEATAADYSMEGDSCGMGPGGRYTNRDLLTGLLMVSGNDCANALARELGGVEATLQKMNDTAKSLQAFDTRAASPSGLDAPGMSTSPYDLALIFRAALREPTFAELIATPTFRFPGHPRNPSIPGDVDHPAYLMHTSNALLLDGYPGMIGGKTGFTDDARKTFVGAAEHGGRRVVIVQMYGLNTAQSSYWDQAKQMFDYAARVPAGSTVGRLVDPLDPSGRAPTTTTPTTSAARQHEVSKAAAAEDGTSHWGKRVLVGLGAALIAVLLLLAGLSINKR